MGYEYDADSIVHSVLILEQLLTTGGGWQDQVGGLLPGFKFSVSPNAFPVAVHTETLPVSPEFVEQVNHRLVCIYTGRQRLARSLLQDVIRHWYAREPSILQAVTDLRDNSYVCRDSILRGDLQAVGTCLSNYWQSKKTMAPQSEPKFVVEMRERLGDIIIGSSLAGAGGGGFFICLTKDADQLDTIKERLATMPGVDDMQYMRAQINMNGLQVTIGDKCIGNPLVKRECSVCFHQCELIQFVLPGGIQRPDCFARSDSNTSLLPTTQFKPLGSKNRAVFGPHKSHGEAKSLMLMPIFQFGHL